MAEHVNTCKPRSVQGIGVRNIRAWLTEKMFGASSRPVVRALIQNAGVVSRLPQQLVHSSNSCQQQRWIHCAYSVPSISGSLLATPIYHPTLEQQRFAARKGTRAKKMSKIVKKEVKKEGFNPNKAKMDKLNANTGPKRLVELGKPDPIDNVYGKRYFKTQPITLAEAIQFHRETNHPTVYDRPDLLVIARVELDMSLDKKNRYMDNLNRIVLLPHLFGLQQRKTVVAFCKSEEIQQEALAAGADLVGGLELIKKVQTGMVSLNEYDHIVGHTDIVNDLALVRGLLKRRFPNIKNGSMGNDIKVIIDRFANGIPYSSSKDAHELDFGVVEVPFGRLTTPTEELEDNFRTLVGDVESCRPRASGVFITHCWVVAPPSREKFLIKLDPYLSGSRRPSGTTVARAVVDEEDEPADQENERDEDDEQPQKQKAEA